MPADNVVTNTPRAGEDPSLRQLMERAEAKAAADVGAIKAARPKPTELQIALDAEARQELATEKYLLDGFFKAKLQNADKEVDLTDVQMIRNLQAVGRHIVDRGRSRA